MLRVFSRLQNPHPLPVSRLDENEKYIQQNRFYYIRDPFRRALETKTRTETQINFYKFASVPTLAYSSETHVTAANYMHMQTIQINEMRYLGCLKAYTNLDHVETNTQICGETDVVF